MVTGREAQEKRNKFVEQIDSLKEELELANKQWRTCATDLSRLTTEHQVSKRRSDFLERENNDLKKSCDTLRLEIEKLNRLFDDAKYSHQEISKVRVQEVRNLTMLLETALGKAKVQCKGCDTTW